MGEFGPSARAELERAMGADADRAGPRLARGCRCLGAWVDGRVAAYGWVSTGPEIIGEVGLQIVPAAGEAYLWNCVTLVPFRRRGVFRALIGHAILTLAAGGARRLWIASLEGTAEQAVIDNGFVPVLRLGIISLGGFRRVSISAAPGAPAATFAPGLLRTLAGRPAGRGVAGRSRPAWH